MLECAALSVCDLQSPNQTDRPPGSAIDTLVLHYTGMRTTADAIERLRDPAPPTGVPVSSHYVVDENGQVFRLVPEERRARHAGISFWRGRENLNDTSIGIEIVNPGHEWGYRDFPSTQIASVMALCRSILARHPIPPVNVVGHSDIAPDRKQDPGERFPWALLARNGIGLWPDGLHGIEAHKQNGGVDHSVIRRQLARLGYRLAPEGLPDQAYATVAQAFQRHWQPDTVTGEPTAKTGLLLAALLNQQRTPDFG